MLKTALHKTLKLFLETRAAEEPSEICLLYYYHYFFFPSPELIGYSPATVYANLIIRAGEQNETVMKHFMF